MTKGRGEVTERLKVLASKASVRETVPWVRIPPSPPLPCFSWVTNRGACQLTLALLPSSSSAWGQPSAQVSDEIYSEGFAVTMDRGVRALLLDKSSESDFLVVI